MLCLLLAFARIRDIILPSQFDCFVISPSELVGGACFCGPYHHEEIMAIEFTDIMTVTAMSLSGSDEVYV